MSAAVIGGRSQCPENPVLGKVENNCARDHGTYRSHWDHQSGEGCRWNPAGVILT